MKKTVALILSLIVVFSLCIPASALQLSPVAKLVFHVDSADCITVNGTTAEDASWNTVGKANVTEGDTACHLTVKPDPTLGTFKSWVITTASGAVAVAGSDYKIISGSLTGETLVFQPLADIKVTGKYDKGSSEPSTPSDSSSESSSSSTSSGSTSSSSTSSTTSGTGDFTKFDTNKNGKYNVRLVGGIPVNKDGGATWTNNEAVIEYDAEKNQLTAKADTSKGNFDNWSIYYYDGKAYVKAEDGTHYRLVSGDLNSPEITITPLADLVICANVNGKVTSPKTGDASAIIFAVFALCALAGITFTTKKILSK